MRSIRILVVEDDDFLASAYRVKLTKSGHSVEVCMNGQEAIEYLNKADEVPEVVLLDLIMPIKDGFETLKELRASKKFASLPVIVTSNLSQQEDIQKALDLGANDYIIKSDTSIEDIIDKILAVL